MNLYKRLIDLLPKTPLLVGTVLDSDNGMCSVEELGGGRQRVRGDAVVGTKVFFRDGMIESAAPDLPEEDIEV